jgi:flagellar biosynthesis repressor protein FlbT
VSGHLKVHLKPNERVYINGGVIKVDRKVTIELLNEVVFLLEGHILQEEQATTPLRQLYFIVQSMLMEPKNEPIARQMYEQSHQALIMTFRNQDVLDGLTEVKALMERGRTFEALRRIRALFPLEDEILEAPDRSAAKLPGVPAQKSVA